MNNNDFIIVLCPHCFDEVIIKKDEVNCKIFCHAVYKHNFQQINPHTPK